MSILSTVLIIVILCFGFVLLFGPPYLPTLKQQSKTALELMDLQPGQTMLELGCGDGRVLNAAAKKGIHSVGYELNPLLFVFAWLNSFRYRKLVTVIWGNYWVKQWPSTDGIFVFIMDKHMAKVDKKIIQQYKGKHVKLVSYTFKVPGKKPTKERGGLFLYTYN